MRSCSFIIGSRGKGVMSELMPSTMKMFKIFDPSTLPIAIPGFFFNAATMEVMSSGNEVAPATTVSPMVLSLMPQFLANIWALRETSSPPR